MTENQENKKRTKVTRSIAERKAAALAELAKLEAMENGTYVRGSNSEEPTILTTLRSMLRRRETVLKSADIFLNGRAASPKSPALNGVDTKIANAQKRIASLQEAKARQEDLFANLPFDIGRLEALVERAEKGEDVGIPQDLHPIPEKTAKKDDAEHEASMAAMRESD